MSTKPQAAGGVQSIDGEELTVVSGPGKTPIYVIVVGVFLMLVLQIIDLAGSDDNTIISGNKEVGGLGGTKFTHGAAAAREDVFVIGVDGEWPPYCHAEITDLPTGNGKQISPTGFLYDVASEACKRDGLECRFPLTGKWTECYEDTGRVGTSLLNDHFDMCLCWTVTPSRLGTAIWPTNDERGWTKQAEGGLLVKKEYQTDSSIKYGDSGRSMWDWLSMDWQDGCDGTQMTLKGTKTADGLRDVWEQCDANGLCRDCIDGKITIGYIKGWALKPPSFTWVTFNIGGRQVTLDDSARARVIWIDEHDPSDGTGKTSMTDYAHVAAALSNGQIDAAYTYTNAIAAHLDTACTICTDPTIWQNLAFKHSGLFFSSGGASGFFKFGQEAKRDRLGQAVDKLIADKATYCPMCNKYWPSADDCESHCIGCTKVDNTCRDVQSQGAGRRLN